MKLLWEFCNEKYFKNSHNDFFALEPYPEGNKNLPKKLECAFLLERTKGGKSNTASCAYTAEQVFTRPGKSSLYPRSNLCNVDDVRSGTDYKNFMVDFKSNTVS